MSSDRRTDCRCCWPGAPRRRMRASGRCRAACCGSTWTGRSTRLPSGSCTSGWAWSLPFLRQLCRRRRADARSACAVGAQRRLPGAGAGGEARSRQRANGSRRWRGGRSKTAMADRALAFDHGQLMAQAVEVTRAEVDGLELPFEFLPEAVHAGRTAGRPASSCSGGGWTSRVSGDGCPTGTSSNLSRAR